MNLCNSKTIHQHHNSLFVKTHKQLKDKHIGYIHLENGPLIANITFTQNL